jgi:hypothetical protein
MTVQHAMLVGAAIIGVSIIASRLIAPYQFSSATGADGTLLIMRYNTITGDAQICLPVAEKGHAVPQCP